MSDKVESCCNCAFLDGKCMMNAIERAGCKLWASIEVLGDKGPLRHVWRMIGKAARPAKPPSP